MPDTRDRLLRLLAATPGLSQTDLAGRLGVSTRTARRHLDALAEAGDVVVTPDGKSRRYRLADRAHPVAPPPPFSEAQVEALSVAARAARPLLAPTPLADALDGALGVLREDWATADVFSFEPEADAAHWSFDGAAGGGPPAVAPGTFRTLLDAARDGRAVAADYYTASRRALTPDRRLGPLGFVVRAGAWMVACVDLDAPGQPVKDFSLVGFRAVAPLDELVDPPVGFDLDDYVRDRFGALDGGVEDVRLLVEPEAAPYFERRRYDPTQQVEPRADGRAVVSFETAGMDAVKAWVLSWGPKVRVLAPTALAEAVAAAHREAAARYDEDGDV